MLRGLEESVGCKGGSRFVDGCWGFPYLKINRFKVSLFLFFGVTVLCFIILWFCGFSQIAFQL